MILWKIYYEDGTTFSSDDGEFKDAPPWGVVQVVCEPNYVYGVDRDGLIDFLCRLGIVKFGRRVSNKDFHKSHRHAHKDAQTIFSSDREIEEGEDYYIWMGALNDQ